MTGLAVATADHFSKECMEYASSDMTSQGSSSSYQGQYNVHWLHPDRLEVHGIRDVAYLMAWSNDISVDLSVNTNFSVGI